MMMIMFGALNGWWVMAYFKILTRNQPGQNQYHGWDMNWKPPK